MKATRPGYAEAPFFFDEGYEGGHRTVAWDERLEQQQALFHALLDGLGERIEYLLKERDMRPAESGEAGEEQERWIRLRGGIKKGDLSDLIGAREEWFFADSGFQLCIREADQKGYFVYDEHGVFYLYDMPRGVALLSEMGYVNRRRELVSDGGHWELRPEDGEQQLASFRKALKLKSLFCYDEAEDLGERVTGGS